MAGLFYLIRGKKDGGFASVDVVKGTDGEPLILPADEKSVTDKICTRPTAVDYDGDGDLDIVAGNFSGTFCLFEGEGKGRFSPKGQWLESANGALKVSAHSDPFFVDWDADGDLDLLSGSTMGSVTLFENTGTRTEPSYGEAQTILAGQKGYSPDITLGDAHLKAPQMNTRIWAGDANGDGKLDLLVGDSLTLYMPAEGVSDEAAHEALAKFETAMEAHMESYPEGDDQEARDAWMKQYQELEKTRDEVCKQDRTGFVWAYYGR